MRKKIITSLLVASMIVASLSGCSSSKKEGDPKASEQGNSGLDKETPLVVGFDPFSEKFSPFFSNSVPDQYACSVTQLRMVTIDRSGQVVKNAKDGETTSYNGQDYTYNGLSNVEVNYDKAKDETTYDIKIRDDVKFSDGEKLTADDLIFSLYVVSDTSYDGSNVVSSLPILGMKNYRANSTVADKISSDEIAKAIKNMPKELKESIKTEIIKATLESEFTATADLYKDPSYKEYTDKYKKQKDLFAFLYSPDKKYDSTKVNDDKKVLSDIIEKYGVDYKKLANAYQGDETYFDSKVNDLAQAYLVETKKAAGEGKDVPNIEGIKKISDTEIQVVSAGYDASLIYQFDMDVAPMHYYGDKSQYDYDNNKFGFPRGDLSIVKDKTTKPLGAGPYKFIKYENKVIYYEANENFYLGAPKTKTVQFKESTDADKATGLVQGTIDLSDPHASKTVFEQIKKENGNGELSGDKLVTNSVDNLGYGYLGMNASTICVGDDPGSKESKNLRKALATIFAVYRDVAIDTYYGDAASVIQYPISNTSWAAPQKSDSDYAIAFSKDVNGADIYTEGMSADDKYAAAKKAALDYLAAAGYTVNNGKVTAAPKGAKLQYEVLIGADGTGDHPAFSVLTDAKEALGQLGITLSIRDFSDTSQLWTSIDTGKQELWVAAWQATPDPDMYQIYHSDNILGHGAGKDNRYQLADKSLDDLIFKARKSDDQAYRKTVYKQCLDIILDWSVEIPLYQRLNCIVFSPQRLKQESVTPAISPFYEWWKEIYNFEMK